MTCLHRWGHPGIRHVGLRYLTSTLLQDVAEAETQTPSEW